MGNGPNGWTWEGAARMTTDELFDWVSVEDAIKHFECVPESLHRSWREDKSRLMSFMQAFGGEKLLRNQCLDIMANS